MDFVVDEPDDVPLAAARRDSGGGGGGGGGGPVPGDGVRAGAGGLLELAVRDDEEVTRPGELVPMNWSAGTPAEFHLIPCGKCFRTYF